MKEHHNSQEFKLAGHPWWADGESADKTVLIHITVEFCNGGIAKTGLHLATHGGLTVSQADKTVLLHNRWILQRRHHKNRFTVKGSQ